MNEDQIRDKLKNFTGWEYRSQAVEKTYRRSGFMEAVEFVNRIAVIAESIDHHPDISIHDYNQITVRTWTRSEEAVTEKDFKLVKEIEKLALELL
jgi:4a-hydroxytetrahydrobiopterin dehydratase